MRVYLLNVKYSENLGDGVISDCLEYLLLRSRFKPEIVVFDLSRKNSFPRPDDYVNSKTKKQMFVEFCRRSHVFKLVIPLLNFAYSILLLKGIRKALSPDIVFIGGGQLVADAEQFFSGRLFVPVLYMKMKLDVKIVFYSIGVSSKIRSFGRLIFKRLLTKSEIYVRDEMSREEVEKTFCLKSDVVPDVGILASLVYSLVPNEGNDVGFCVSSPLALSLHSSEATILYGVSFYIDKIKTLIDGGRRVSLFTNGLEEDDLFMRVVMDKYVSIYGTTDSLVMENRFLKPEQLVKFISSCEYIFAHRMHACIVATSYGIPAFGFGWDVKLESFYRDSKISHLFVSANEASAANCLDLINAVDPILVRKTAELLVSEAKNRHLMVLNKLGLECCYE